MLKSCSAHAAAELCAHRALTKLSLANKYVSESDGTLHFTEALPVEDAPCPFKCYFDVDSNSISKGNRAFGAMKGASDDAIFLPHPDK